jgi:hypothetical protein
LDGLMIAGDPVLALWLDMDLRSHHNSGAAHAVDASPGREGTHRPPTIAIDSRVVNRVRAEFAEMRGFSPTLSQAARLFDLSRADCHRVLESLVSEGVLQVTPDGCYRLMSAG